MTESQPKKEEKRSKLKKPKPLPEKKVQSLLQEEARKAVEAVTLAQKELYAQKASDTPSTSIGHAAISQLVEGMQHVRLTDQDSSQQVRDQGIPVLKRAFLASTRLRREEELDADDILLHFLLVLYNKDTRGPPKKPGYDISLQDWVHSTVFSHYQTLVDVHGWWNSDAGSWEHDSFEKAVAIAKHFLLTLEIRNILHRDGDREDRELTQDEEKSIEGLKEKRRHFSIFLESKLEKKLKADVSKREQQWEEATRKLR